MRSRIKDIEKNIKYMTVDLTSKKELEEEERIRQRNNKIYFTLFMLLALFFVVAGLFVLPIGWVLIVGGIFIFIWGLLIAFF